MRYIVLFAVVLLAAPAGAQNRNPCGTIPSRALQSGNATTNNFYLVGAQICDPNGDPYMAKGINLTGGWGLDLWVSAHINVVDKPSSPSLAQYYKDLGFNAVRLVILDPPSAGLDPRKVGGEYPDDDGDGNPDYSPPERLEGCINHAPGCVDYSALHSGESNAEADYEEHVRSVINDWTSRGMVVMIENHSGENGDNDGQSALEIAHARTKMRAIAAEYGWPDGPSANAYVWLELNNEPLEEGNQRTCVGAVADPWPIEECTYVVALEEYHRDITSDIRLPPGSGGDGAENIVVWNASHYGQDRYSGVEGDYNESESYILWSGPIRVDNDTPNNFTTFANLIYDVHIYSRWGLAGAAGITKYFTALKDAGIATVVGETGGDPTGSHLARIDWPGTSSLYRAKPPGIGIFCWYCIFDSLSGSDATNDYGVKLVIQGDHPSNVAQFNWINNPPSSRVDDIAATPYSVGQQCLP